MPVRSIIKWPDPRLQVIASPIEEVNEDTRNLAKDLLDTMISEFGAGLAATQVGIDKAVCVVKSNFSFVSTLPPDPILPEGIVLVNPQIEILSDEKFVWREGCLSVGNFEDDVSRYKKINIHYTDLLGNSQSFLLENQMAGVIQHEVDHLIGKVFIDRLSPSKQKNVKAKISMKKRADAARLKKAIKKQKIAEKLEAQNEDPPRPGFRRSPMNKGKIQSKKKRAPKIFGKNKRRKK